MNTITITYAGETITLTWNGAEASAPLRLNGDLTQYQTADARHRTAEAVRLVAGLAWPDVDFADGSEAWDELEYETIGAVRTTEAWWAWHDADSSRWYETTEDADEACAAWVSGRSDVGPEVAVA